MILAQTVPFRPMQCDPETGLVSVPGSWLPLLLIVAIFCFKYAVSARLAMHPDSSNDAAFGTVAALVYGAFAGRFAVPALRALRSLNGVRRERSEGQAGLA